MDRACPGEARDSGRDELHGLGRRRLPSGSRGPVEGSLQALVEQQIAADLVGALDLRCWLLIAAQDIVAVAPGKHVTVAAALENVVAGAPVEIVLMNSAGQRVVAVVADQHVVPSPFRLPVPPPPISIVAAIALQHVVDVAAGQRVGELRAHNILDARIGIAGRLGAGAAAGAGAEVDRDPGPAVGADVVDGVGPEPALQAVGSQPADQHVVAVAALQRIVAAPAE